MLAFDLALAAGLFGFGLGALAHQVQICYLTQPSLQGSSTKQWMCRWLRVS